MHCCTRDIFIIWLKNNDQACLAPSLKVGLMNEKELDNSKHYFKNSSPLYFFKHFSHIANLQKPEGNGSLYMTQFCMGGHI